MPPANPASVSGPGALSQRTDGGPTQPIRVAPGQPYGDRQQLEELQRAAPLPAAAQSAPGGGAQGISADAITPLSAPSQKPGEPVTAGVDIGAGPGTGAITALRSGPQRVSDVISKYVASDTSGRLADMYMELVNMGV